MKRPSYVSVSQINNRVSTTTLAPGKHVGYRNRAAANSRSTRGNTWSGREPPEQVPRVSKLRSNWTLEGSNNDDIWEQSRLNPAPS